jgi:hypothetical protein
MEWKPEESMHSEMRRTPGQLVRRLFVFGCRLVIYVCAPLLLFGLVATVAGFWGAVNPYVSETMDLGYRSIDGKNDSVVTGRLSADSDTVFPTSLTFTVDQVTLRSHAVHSSEGAVRACIRHFSLGLGAHVDGLSLGWRNEDIDPANFTEPSDASEQEVTPNRCIDLSNLARLQVDSQILDNLGWAVHLELNGTEQVFYNFPFDEFSATVSVIMLLSQYDEQGREISRWSSHFPDEQAVVTMPGWDTHQEDLGISLTRPYLEVRVTSVGLLTLLLFLTLLLWSPRLGDQYFQGVIALLVAFWTVREIIIGGQPFGALLFDRFFIIGQAGILLSLAAWVRHRIQAQDRWSA